MSTGERLDPLWIWGLPTDTIGQAALVAGALVAAAASSQRLRAHVLAWLAPATWQERRRTRGRWLGFFAFLSALLSLAYMALILRGGPRIIDATSYMLEGRALAEGHFTWAVPEPSASLRGRFLLYTGDHTMGVIFPPGYPALLALAFRIGAPLVVGPLLAACLIVATYLFAHEVGRRASLDPRARELAARLATLFVVVSGALRYHTSDTMSHGLTATLITLSIATALRSARTESRGALLAASFAAGWCFATRPVSAVVPALALAWIAIRSRTPVRACAAALAGAAPGALLFFSHQVAVTGEWWSSSQRAYYAVSDGPTDCFRYGFGDVGCRVEHADFVANEIARGFGAFEAVRITALRLLHHALDLTNAEPLTAAAAVLVVLLARQEKIARWLLLAAGAHALVYAPFYFEGSYPGGGARLFADILPLEITLIAIAVVRLAPAKQRALVSLLALSASLGGYALRASHQHVSLRDREHGRPMFEPRVLAEARVKRGLVFVSTDHGFNLGHDPDSRASHSIRVVRLRGDSRDRLLWESLGSPPSYRYDLDERGPRLLGWIPPEPDRVRGHVFELEAEWPALAQHGGWAAPIWFSGTGASGDRALVVTPDFPDRAASVVVSLPIPPDAPPRWTVTPIVIRLGEGARSTLEVLVHEPDPEASPPTWTFDDSAGPEPAGGKPGPRPERLAPMILPLSGAAVRLRLTASRGRAAWDAVEVRALDP